MNIWVPSASSAPSVSSAGPSASQAPTKATYCSSTGKRLSAVSFAPEADDGFMMSVTDDFPDNVIGGVGSEGVKRLVMIDSGACDTAFKKQDFPGAALDKS